MIAPHLAPAAETAPAADADVIPEASPAAFDEVIRPALVKYCAACHDPADESNPVDFLRAETAGEIGRHRGLWASVAEQLHNRTMPPADEPQPSEAERVTLSLWIEEYLQRTACNGGQFAGNPVPRRLNRDQYTYAVEDLTGMDFDFVETLPADGGGGEGFDNNGETLFLPPLLMERYLEVAQQIVDRVIVTEPIDTMLIGDAEQTVSLAPGETTSVLATAYTDADFRVTVTAGAERDADAGKEADAGKDDIAAALVLRVDGIDAGRFEIADTGDGPAEPVELRAHLARGPHELELAVPEEDTAVSIQRLRLEQVIDEDPKRRQRRLEATRRLTAPAGELLESDPEAAASKIVRRFTRRAWRRPVEDGELERLMTLYRRGTERGEPLRQAIKLPLIAALVSPNFLFLVEQVPEEPGIHPVSDLELASRLSFFLWYSLPDEELIRLAENEQLHRPDVLRGQVRRMLDDPRSYRFAEAFAGQWLGTVAVGRTKIPDTNFFKPVYTTELVADLRRQVGETMHWMLKNNRPLTEWLDADYAIVNRRLAEHYGLPSPPEGDAFVKVELEASGSDGHRRAGVLGLGAVHMLTSYARRTSPVLRGGWVLETMFGTRLPPPPPDVPNLPGGEKEVENKTVRERLAQHRADPTCAACHDLIDPIGFALENFDVLGQWRDKEGEHEIDARGQLPSGETFTGPAELRSVLLERQDDFLEEFCRRMLGFALGRSLEDADACTVGRLADRLKENDDQAEALILGIVESVPFRSRGESAPSADGT